MLVKVLKVSCHRCGHTWALRKDKLSLRCPRCFTYKWMVRPDPTDGKA